jgi:hypothetical protein
VPKAEPEEISNEEDENWEQEKYDKYYEGELSEV